MAGMGENQQADLRVLRRSSIRGVSESLDRQGAAVTVEDRRMAESAAPIVDAVAAVAASEKARQERFEAVLASVSERSQRSPEETARLREQLLHLGGV